MRTAPQISDKPPMNQYLSGSKGGIHSSGKQLGCHVICETCSMLLKIPLPALCATNDAYAWSYKLEPSTSEEDTWMLIGRKTHTMDRCALIPDFSLDVANVENS